MRTNAYGSYRVADTMISLSIYLSLHRAHGVGSPATPVFFFSSRQVQSEPPIIPRTTPDRVYDIRYWPRDAKREHVLVGGTNKKFQEVTWVETGIAVEPQAFCLSPPEMSAYRPFKATRKPLLEVTNDGYE